jgi:hypothetical protein
MSTLPPMHAKARNTDPVTSHIAARDVDASGVAYGQRAACLSEVIARPGQTASEISVALELERIVGGKRLPELREAGFVKNGPSRACRVTGNRCMTWFPVTLADTSRGE